MIEEMMKQVFSEAGAIAAVFGLMWFKEWREKTSQVDRFLAVIDGHKDQLGSINTLLEVLLDRRTR